MTALTALFHRTAATGSHGLTLFRALAAVRTWHNRAAQRRELARLSPEMLRDLGISSYEAEQEAQKPFWVE